MVSVITLTIRMVLLRKDTVASNDMLNASFNDEPSLYLKTWIYEQTGW
jgi:hypothetical protein